MPTPLIWHITTRTAWEAAVPSGWYRTSTRGKDLDEVGFIHASWPEQVSVVAKRIYPDRPDDLVILEIDPQRVEATGTAVDVEPASDEAEAPGGSYPHVRGPIPVSAVVRLRRTRWIGREFVVVA
jgi:uncharacterized protein (DUF952 family)